MTTPSEPAAGGTPREIQLAFWLWIVTAVLVFITSVLLFASRGLAMEQARKSPPPGVTAEQAESIAGTTVIGLTVAGVVLAGLLVWAATKLRTGTGWARVLLTVAGVAIILFNMLGFTLLGVMTAIGAFTGVVVMYLRPSQDFFVSAKRAA